MIIIRMLSCRTVSNVGMVSIHAYAHCKSYFIAMYIKSYFLSILDAVESTSCQTVIIYRKQEMLPWLLQLHH